MLDFSTQFLKHPNLQLDHFFRIFFVYKLILPQAAETVAKSTTNFSRSYFEIFMANIDR